MMHSPAAIAATYDELSSPDPLTSPATDLVREAPRPKRIAPSAATRKHNAARASLDSISNLPPSSPSRTVTEQTLSPWRIRVTVEAEPEHSGDGQIQTITRTMQVPLKGECPPTRDHDARSNGSQPKSRAGSKSITRRKSATPTTERRRRESVTDLDIIVLGDDASEDEWSQAKKKTSPRKSRATKDHILQITTKLAGSNSTEFQIRQDSDVEQYGQDSVRDDSPELRQIDLNRVSVRSRANSTRTKGYTLDDATDEPSYQSLKPAPIQSAITGRTVSANSGMTYPTPSPTASERGCSAEAEDRDQVVDDHAAGFDTIMESEGFTMIDLDSIPSVKQMLSSPLEDRERDQSNRLLSPSGSEDTVRRKSPNPLTKDSPAQIKPLRAIPPHLVLPEGDSEISSTVPSSPPSFDPRPEHGKMTAQSSHLLIPAQPRNRQVTPQPYTSPKLPSPPRQSVLKDRSTPVSGKAMKAGLALQGAIDPISLYPTLPSQSAVEPKEIFNVESSRDPWFKGYDSDTQRELRAGLRFGEELAKRHRTKVAALVHNVQQDENSPPEVWRGESVISRTPVQAFQEQLQSNKRSTVVASKTLDPSSTPRAYTEAGDQHPNTAARREHEWQLEREAVSKQIQTASPSKVIVIDSDDESGHDLEEPATHDQPMEDETMSDGDIWLDEAKDSSSSPRQEEDTPKLINQTQKDSQPSKTEYVPERGPRRPIPSPWKRGEQSDANNSTIITNGEELSGFLWKQDQTASEAHFGDTAINNIKRELMSSGEASLAASRISGSFDIEKMLGTPQRIRQSLDNEQEKPLSHDSLQQDSSEHTDDDIADEDEVEAEVDRSHESYESDESVSSAQQAPLMIPVKFDASALSQAQTTPPPSITSQVDQQKHEPLPPTPRSAIKGSRPSFGAVGGGVALNGVDQSARRVVFAQRSKGVNVDWVESSSSVQLSTEDLISSPIVEHQRHQEQRHSVQDTLSQLEPEPQQQTDADNGDVENENQGQRQKGWLGWFWKNGQSNSNGSTTSSTSAPQIDGTVETSETTNEADTDSDQYFPTSRHTHSSQSARAQSEVKKHSHRSQQKQHETLGLPSYLVPPSYPSDPTRNRSSILASSGSFTNTHFRTLHILHRKSQRPRFRAPNLSSCRPDLRALVTTKWKLQVDESEAGLGGFAWTVGDTEARVLERFCREIEVSTVYARDATEREINEVVEAWLENKEGMWTGDVPHGKGDVAWGWDVEDLATRLGRIVVGEVVRKEEFGGK